MTSFQEKAQHWFYDWRQRIVYVSRLRTTVYVAASCSELFLISSTSTWKQINRVILCDVGWQYLITCWCRLRTTARVLGWTLHRHLCSFVWSCLLGGLSWNHWRYWISNSPTQLHDQQPVLVWGHVVLHPIGTHHFQASSLHRANKVMQPSRKNGTVSTAC